MVVSGQLVVGGIVDIALNHNHVRTGRGETSKELPGFRTTQTVFTVEQLNQMRHVFRISAVPAAVCEPSHTSHTFRGFDRRLAPKIWISRLSHEIRCRVDDDVDSCNSP